MKKNILLSSIAFLGLVGLVREACAMLGSSSGDSVLLLHSGGSPITVDRPRGSPATFNDSADAFAAFGDSDDAEDEPDDTDSFENFGAGIVMIGRSVAPSQNYAPQLPTLKELKKDKITSSPRGQQNSATPPPSQKPKGYLTLFLLIRFCGLHLFRQIATPGWKTHSFLVAMLETSLFAETDRQHLHPRPPLAHTEIHLRLRPLIQYLTYRWLLCGN